MRECACSTLGLCATYDGNIQVMLNLGLAVCLGPLLAQRSRDLRLSAAKAMRNLSANALGSLAICAEATNVSALEKTLKVLDDTELMVEVSACIANLALQGDNLSNILSPRMCRLSVPPSF